MSKQDGVGSIGESFIQHVMQVPVNVTIKFKVTHLGERYRLFDFMVNLLDEEMSSFWWS